VRSLRAGPAARPKADRIVVLSDGQIAEIGTHEKLLERDGSYAAMAALAGALTV
jgi:ABC-type multidrug transport system fused ATPase/permease subunit